MWPLNLLRTRHWVLLGLSVLFLLTYSGFVSWGKVELALEYLADQPAVRQRFATPIGRGEAIVTAFMFVLLTPLALAAAGGVVAFVGAIGAGIIRMFVPFRQLPDWFFLGAAYEIGRASCRERVGIAEVALECRERHYNIMV